MRGKLLFDIEGNGLLDKIDTIWLIAAIDLDTQEEMIFTEYDDRYPGLHEFMQLIPQYKVLVNHNLIGYDLEVLYKFYNYTPSHDQKLIDTLLISQATNFKRFNRRHGLQAWAESYGESKTEIEAWDKWDGDLIERGIKDCRLTKRVYEDLLKEVATLRKYHPVISTTMQALHATATFVARSERTGWKIDKPRLLYYMRVMERLMQRMEDKVLPHLPGQFKPKFTVPHWDREKALAKYDNGLYKDYQPWGQTRMAKFVKSGNYDHHTAKMFGITPESAKSPGRLLEPGVEFTPIIYVEPKMGSNDDQKRLLHKLSWQPLDWNRQKQSNGRWKNTTPKLCETSLRACGPLGKYIHVYNQTASRYSILAGWRDALDENSYLHGGAAIVGTPTFRLRHRVIANIVSTDTPWGKCVRRLFICEPDEVIVGGDSAGNQARALCHHIDDDDFTRENLEGDLHSKNASDLTTSRAVVSRGQAKRWYYASTSVAQRLGDTAVTQPATKAHVKLREFRGHPFGAILSEARYRL